MFNLEEDEIDIIMRYYSYVYYKLRGQKFSSQDMQSINENHVIPQEVIDTMESDLEFARYADAFEECVEFSSERNPTGMFHVVKDYMEQHGKVYFKKDIVTYTDELGIKHINEKRSSFDRYEPDDPNQYVISISDHVGLLSTERGADTLKASIERHSMNNVILRNRYGCTPVVIQQQNMETTNLAAITAGRIRPTKDGLKDSKRTGEDCTVMLGITNPKAFDLPNYLGYDVTMLKDKLRILEVVLHRKGIANGLCPLYFEGSVCSFTELPKPNDPTMADVYDYLRRESSVSFFTFNKKVSNKVASNNFIHYLCSRFRNKINKIKQWVRL